MVGANKRAANARRVRDAEALLDRRYFSLDPKRWAAFQAVLHAPARPNPRLKKLLQTPSVFECADARKWIAEDWKVYPLARKPLIPKTRRDVRVVEGARLENDSGESHRATAKHPIA